MPLMLLFQVHRSFPLSVFLFCFVFLVLVRSVWTYIFFYISWDLCGCKNMQMLCRSACFKRFMCVRLFVSLCFSCAFSPFFFFFFFAFWHCQTVEGRHTVSHLLYRGVFSGLREAGCAAVNLPPRPALRVVCLVVEGDSEIYGEWQIIAPHPTPQCAVSLWGYVLIRCLSEPQSQCQSSLSIFPLSPYLRLFLTRLQSASQSRCSSPARLQQGAGSHLQQRLIDLIMQYTVIPPHMRCTYTPSHHHHHHQKMSLDEGNVAEMLITM